MKSIRTPILTFIFTVSLLFILSLHLNESLFVPLKCSNLVGHWDEQAHVDLQNGHFGPNGLKARPTWNKSHLGREWFTRLPWISSALRPIHLSLSPDLAIVLFMTTSWTWFKSSYFFSFTYALIYSNIVQVYSGFLLILYFILVVLYYL